MMDKILIVGPAWVGDMVMAQSLFKLLKQQRPHAIIDVLAPDWSLPLIQRMPEVSSAIVLPFKHGELALYQRYQLARSLRKNRYTQAILLPNSFKSALIPFWANIPQRTGWRGEMRYVLLNDIRHLDKTHYPMMIERFMALGLPAQAVLPHPYPLPSLTVSDTSCQVTLKNHHLVISSRPILALCPGAEFGPAKRWPAEYYAHIANAKLKEGWEVWLLGSPKDKPDTKRIMALTHECCHDLAGSTTLEEATDLLSLATLIISNDSGLMHIAAALHKPLVAIFGPTSTTFTPPLHPHSKILTQQQSCQPCFQRTCPLQHHRCMLDLHPDKVLNSIKEWRM